MFLALAILGSVVSLPSAQNLLLNGSFESGSIDWQVSGDAQLDRATANTGSASIRIQNGSARQDITGVSVGEKFTCSATFKVNNLHKTGDAGYAYVAIYQLDDFGDVVTAHDFVQATGNSEWQSRSYTFTVVEGCQIVSVRCGIFQATGTAWFDDLTLAAGEQPLSFAQILESEKALGKQLGLHITGPNVAVYKDDILPSGAPASPDYLASVLRDSNFGVAYLNSDQLADRQYLNRANFDVLVLPYGASFPVKTADNFRRFLRSGGKFFSTGGCAFDNLLERTAEGWRAPIPIPSSAIDHVLWHFEIPAEELRDKGQLTFSGWLKAANVSGPGMAFFALYQTAADGSLPEWKDLCRVTGSQGWQEIRYTFRVHPKAKTVDLRAGLFRCRGVACFDDIRLTDESGHVLLNSDFENTFNPDQQGRGKWIRSHAQFCELQTRTHHSGQRALKARLSYQPPTEERLNTRHGIPADGLEVEPTQLGVFQPDYLLERVKYAQAAPEQSIIRAHLKIKGSLEGYAACGVVGFNHARWLPLLNAYDSYGRLRGAAGALLRQYAGPYAGSSWAFFGVTNQNLFCKYNPMCGAFVDIINSLVRDTYFTSLTTESACYRQGETVLLLPAVMNGGRKEISVRLSLYIYEGEPPSGSETNKSKPAATLSKEIYIPPGTTNLVRLPWAPARFKTDFYHVVGRLVDTETEAEIDRIDSGFIVLNQKVISRGPKLSYCRNYLRIGKRPAFLFGTDDWGYVFNTTRETPLQWLLDMRQRRDLGVNLYENLQFGLPSSSTQQELLLRKVDGIVQLAQKHDQVYFPCLLCGYEVAVNDAVLERQKSFCRDYAQRYANIPGLIYYLNGDLRCELSDTVTPHWNQFLRERYGTTEKLKHAWGKAFHPGWELGRIPAEQYYDWGHRWEDIKIYDQNLFRAWLIRRWNSALISGIRQFDRTHPTTAEFYQLPHGGVDIPAGIGGLDLSNFGYFDRPGADIARFPAISKFDDQRARGKSFGPGEYGVKTHPAWAGGQDYNYHIARTREQSIDLFLAIAHYSLGMGASRIQNWCWKDDAHRVFPWGMVYPCDNVPKDIAYVHRNQSLLFRQFVPVYEEPTVYVLTPDAHRFGGGKWQVIEGILQSINLALATHVHNLGTLNEFNLEIPKSAKAIFYPLPFCPGDDAYNKVLNWVRAGGVLYTSGDISCDQLRQRTRRSRLEELCGVRFLAENYPNISLPASNALDHPCIKVENAGATVLKKAVDGTPLLVENNIGKGLVIFTTDPIELHSVPARQSGDIDLYRSILQRAGVQPSGLEPNNPLIHVFRLPLQDGGLVYVLFNTDESAPIQRVTLKDCQPPVTLDIARKRPALLWFDGKRVLRAVESQGQCTVGGNQILTDNTGGIVLALDDERLDSSKELLLMPLQPGSITLHLSNAWKTPTLTTGEIRNGKWKTFETRLLNSIDPNNVGTRSTGHLQTFPPLAPGVINVGTDQVFSLLILHEGKSARWQKSIDQSINVIR